MHVRRQRGEKKRGWYLGKVTVAKPLIWRNFCIQSQMLFKTLYGAFLLEDLPFFPSLASPKIPTFRGRGAGVVLTLSPTEFSKANIIEMLSGNLSLPHA